MNASDGSMVTVLAWLGSPVISSEPVGVMNVVVVVVVSSLAVVWSRIVLTSVIWRSPVVELLDSSMTLAPDGAV